MALHTAARLQACVAQINAGYGNADAALVGDPADLGEGFIDGNAAIAEMAN